MVVLLVVLASAAFVADVADQPASFVADAVDRLVVLPADASTKGRYTMSSQSIRELFEEYELNVIAEPIMNPPDDQGRRTNHKSYGVNVMRQMLELGTLHVNENCVEFLREAQNYYADEKGRFSIIKLNNQFILFLTKD